MKPSIVLNKHGLPPNVYQVMPMAHTHHDEGGVSASSTGNCALGQGSGTVLKLFELCEKYGLKHTPDAMAFTMRVIPPFVTFETRNKEGGLIVSTAVYSRERLHTLLRLL